MLIEDVITLPALLRLRSKGFLERLYEGQRLSARQIARLTGLNHSRVLRTLDRFGIPRNGNGHTRIGHVPFGFDYHNHQPARRCSSCQVICRAMPDGVPGFPDFPQASKLY